MVMNVNRLVLTLTELQTFVLGLKGKPAANMGFAKMGADGNRVSTFCFSIWLHIQLDVINLAMCKSSTFIYKFSFR